MALTLDQLTTPMTPDEVKASIYAVLATVGTNTTSWKPGAVARTIIAGVSIVLAAFSTLMALIAKSGFLELAEGEWLTLVARHVFGVEREEETFAAGPCTISNSGGGVFDFDPGDLIVRNSSTDKTYYNTASIHLGSGQTGLTIAVQAFEAGSASSSNPTDIDEVVTNAIGVTVTNATAIVGLDAELDPVLRLRCLEKRSSLSPNGPRDAYAFFARGAKRADGSSIGVTRVRVTKSSSTGQVTVTVATATGGVTGDVDDPDTDLGAIDEAIQLNVVPDAVTATVQSATALVIPVTYEVWIYSTASMTTQQVKDAIAAKLTSFMTTQPIAGNIIAPATGKVFLDAIRTAIGATRPEIFHVAVTVPGGDTDVAATEVPVLGTVTCTAVNMVTP